MSIHATRLRLLCLVIAVAIILPAALAACSSGSSQPTSAPAATSAPESPAIDGASVLNKSCSSCHAVSRATSLRKTQAEWEQTITRMIAQGAKVNDAEKAALLQYLAANYGK